LAQVFLSLFQPLMWRFALLALSTALSTLSSESPVGRVVDLIQQLKAKIEADGKAEQQVYDKFACWCETTINNKLDEISTNQTDIQKYSDDIEEASGTLGSLSAEIDQLKKDIAENRKSQADATAIREKENAEYTQFRFESEQTIGALEHAVKVLQGAGEKKPKAAMLEQAETLSVVAGVRSALAKFDTSRLPKSAVAALEAFLAHPEEMHKASFMQVQQNPFGDYAPASTQIQGILKSMYDEFTSKMESANVEEGSRNKVYKELMAQLSAELEILGETLTRSETTQAESDEKKAKDKVGRRDTQKELALNKKFLEETREGCRVEAEAWAERSRLRTEELGGITQAILVLTEQGSGDSRKRKDVFRRAAANNVSFLQESEARHIHAAMDKISDLARSTHSLRLASLVVRARATGHFDKVIVMVEKMVELLRQEDQDDIDAKRACERDFNDLNGDHSDLAREKKQQEALIRELETKMQTLTREISQADRQKKDQEKEVRDLQEERATEKKTFQTNLADDREAARLIGKAIETLSAFYKNNELKMGNFVQEEPRPEYTVDKEKRPETFSKSYGGRSSETGGIVAILKMIKEDVEHEMEESVKADKEAATEFWNMVNTLRKSIDQLKQSIANMTSDRSDAEQEKTDTESAKNGTSGGQSTNKQAFNAHCVECKWIYSNTSPQFATLSDKCDSFQVAEVSSFNTRKESREAEINGLEGARAALAGAREGPAEK